MRKANDINAFLASLAKVLTLYLPVDGKAGATFEEWTDGATLAKSLNTNRSPKDFFFPQSECLMEFKREGKNIEIIDTRREHEDFAVFGVRACDARAFAVLDNVFLGEPTDTFYKNRREHGVIMTLACEKPGTTCFCGTFGIDAADPADGDISCRIIDGALYLDAKTEKGKALMAKLENVTEDADADTAKVEENIKTIRERYAKTPLAGLKKDAFGPGKTEKFFNAPEWKELYESCLGCGTCTFVCPTCQCYDIKDFDTGHGVIRHRCWDSCMYSDFTKMSAGQPRLTQMERFRQRFMHKLVYYPERYNGLFSCVGCGRCVQKCPINMNIVKVMKKLGGADNA